jgi:hypothetical protein
VPFATLLGLALLFSAGMWYVRPRHIRAIPNVGDEFGNAFKARFNGRW